MSAFSKQAIAAGFSQQQADFLDTMLAKFPHTHESDEITDFDESVTQIVEDAEVAEIDD